MNKRTSKSLYKYYHLRVKALRVLFHIMIRKTKKRLNQQTTTQRADNAKLRK